MHVYRHILLQYQSNLPSPVTPLYMSILNPRPPSLWACHLHVCLLALLVTYLSTFLPTCHLHVTSLLTYQPTYLLTELHTYLLTYLPTCIPSTCLPTFSPPTHLLTFVSTCWPIYLLPITHLPTNLSIYLLTYWLTYLITYLLSTQHSCLLTIHLPIPSHLLATHHIYLSIYLSIYLFYQSIYLSTYQSV